MFPETMITHIFDHLFFYFHCLNYKILQKLTKKCFFQPWTQFIHQSNFSVKINQQNRTQRTENPNIQMLKMKRKMTQNKDVTSQNMETRGRDGLPAVKTQRTNIETTQETDKKTRIYKIRKFILEPQTQQAT